MKAQQSELKNKKKRHEFIQELLLKNGSVTIESLESLLPVSVMTIHRDLQTLDEVGFLRKVRGGASVVPSAQFESGISFRSLQEKDEKQHLANLASQFVNQGDVVILDDSTTVAESLAFLIEKRPLTVITNFLPTIDLLSRTEGINLIALGGEYVAQYASFLGVVCEKSLSNLYADILLVSSSALRSNDVYHQDPREVVIKRAMMRASNKRVLILDHTKIGHGALHKLASLKEFTHVVVSNKVDGEILDLIKESGIELVVCDKTI